MSDPYADVKIALIVVGAATVLGTVIGAVVGLAQGIIEVVLR